jgi:glycosyltransferase involved in cell wall biosynthesis
VPIANPDAAASAALALMRDNERWHAAQRAAVARAETHYRQDQMVEAYRQVYAEASAWPA